MKKFYSIIPLQVDNSFKGYRYESTENPRLNMDKKTRFPIMTAINGYVSLGETFKVVVVVNDNNPSRENLRCFEAELKEICNEKSCSYPEILVITTPEDSSAGNVADMFEKLIACAEEGDDIFACMTFGTKIQAETLLLAVRYSCRIVDGSSLECLVYGEIRRPEPDRDTWYGKIFDVTFLNQLDEIVRLLSDRKASNPKEFIRQVLSL